MIRPEDELAYIKAVIQPTRLQRLERALQIYNAAEEAVQAARKSGSPTQLDTACFILMGAREEAERLLGPPEPPQAA